MWESAVSRSSACGAPCVVRAWVDIQAFPTLRRPPCFSTNARLLQVTKQPCLLEDLPVASIRHSRSVLARRHRATTSVAVAGGRGFHLEEGSNTRREARRDAGRRWLPGRRAAACHGLLPASSVVRRPSPSPRPATTARGVARRQQRRHAPSFAPADVPADADNQFPVSPFTSHTSGYYTFQIFLSILYNFFFP